MLMIRKVKTKSGSTDIQVVQYIGHSALATALQALQITGEAITTPFSFVATTHALWWNNIKPVFVDIEPDLFNLDTGEIPTLA